MESVQELEDDETASEESTILYEIICCAEWTQLIEDSAPLSSNAESALTLLSYVNPSLYLRGKSLSPYETITWLKSLAQHWQFAATSDGKIVAILQDVILETRSSRDNFTTHLGKNNVIRDPYPNFRCMCWSKDSSLLAIAFTNGLIVFYNIMAVQLFSIRRDGPLLFEQDLNTPTNDFNIDNYLVGFFFTEERLAKTTYCSELITIDRRAHVHCYRQSSADQVELHHESLAIREHYPNGSTAVTYSETHSVIIVAGFLNTTELSTRLSSSNKYGLTIWRLLRDVPYYRLVHSVEAHDSPQIQRPLSGQAMWKMALALTRTKSSTVVQDPITKVALSPNGALASGIHISGAISIWHMPSLKFQSFWPLITQLHYSTENPRFNHRWRQAFNRSRTRRPIDSWRFHPFQISWWNNHTIVIARVNGCVTLCSTLHDFPSQNLLGDSPELFECPIVISNRFGSKGFVFALESEYRLKDGGLMKDEKERRSISHLPADNVRSDSSSQQQDDEAIDEEGSVLKRFAKELLFWATDMERFRPPRKRSKSKKIHWKYSQRLFKLQSITPLELFLRKIEYEEYGEALDLAQVYHLDCDLVFQRQWKRSQVSIHTIRNYLSKIKKRTWVLQECLERVPETEEAARELLDFGLRGTDLPALVVVSEGRDKGQFILWTSKDLELTQEEYLQLIEPSNPEVLRLLEYRQKYLHYLEMLDTYESILLSRSSTGDDDDGDDDEKKYNAEAYGSLRTKSPHESAIEMARNCDLHGLRIMFTHHWTQIAPFVLVVLSSFPETLSPHEYRDFLPELSSDGKECFFWDEFVSTKTKDWCEELLSRVHKKESTVHDSNARIRTLLTPETVSQWYEARIKEIEDSSGMTNLALELARLGLQRNVNRLRSLVQTLEVAEMLVYDMAMLDITIDKLEKLQSLERLQLVMSKTTPDTIIQHFTQFAVPFLHQCDEIEPGAKFTLLNQYLTSISTTNLELTFKMFEYFKKENELGLKIDELMELATNSIYACETTHQNENIFNILGCLPDRSISSMSSTWTGSEWPGITTMSPKSKRRVELLHGTIDELESHYNAIQILEKYGIYTTVKWIRTLEEFSLAQTISSTDHIHDATLSQSFISTMNDSSMISSLDRTMDDRDNNDGDNDDESENDVTSLFTKMCRLASRIHPPLKVTEWKTLLFDMLDLQKKNFSQFPMEKCFEIYVKALLISGRPEIISLAKDFICKDENQSNPSQVYSSTFDVFVHQLSYGQSLDFILDAGFMYFDSSFNYSDNDIALVKVVLGLIPSCQDSRITHLTDLIDVVKIFVRDFEMNILPQTVRHSQDKLGLLTRAMENTQKGYRKLSQLVKIGLYLRIENTTSTGPRILGLPEVESIVLAMAGEAALAAFDCKWAVQICQSIMLKGYSTPSTLWSLFNRLSKWGDDEEENVEAKLSPLTPQLRQAFITYALNICPDNEIQNVLRVSYIIEMKSLRRRMEELSPDENEAAPGSFKTQDEESIVNNLLGKIKMDPLLETTSRWLNPLSKMVKQIKPSFSTSSSQHHEAAEYSTSSTDSYTNPTVELCRILNRIWHLERLVLGSTDLEVQSEIKDERSSSSGSVSEYDSETNNLDS